MTKRLHFRDNKLIGIDSGQPVVVTGGQVTIEIEASVMGADEIVEIDIDEKEFKKNFDKVTLSPKKEILIDGKKSS
ncbi:hypothetical protein LCGC14_0971540 [marine sediment metagenome]|uniref:Uncharacterized protein n=1 Tax=marine sediment metagenome TaxID=412755 RepID=A0A0F9QUP5_9ZZZZ